ncbi:hypothetical protein [Hydrocarboniphaga effusa]|uniref:hypothetical protein n=1 Tax=Hydrocarboniphaga effusa TaxID=243629 RepID=UPI003BAA9435
MSLRSLLRDIQKEQEERRADQLAEEAEAARVAAEKRDRWDARGQKVIVPTLLDAVDALGEVGYQGTIESAGQGVFRLSITSNTAGVASGSITIQSLGNGEALLFRRVTATLVETSDPQRLDLDYITHDVIEAEIAQLVRDMGNRSTGALNTAISNLPGIE